MTGVPDFRLVKTIRPDLVVYMELVTFPDVWCLMPPPLM